jgi:rRNA small subunit methyltransferase G
MNTAQIAELLEPFLRAPVAIPDGSCNSELSSSCHSEPAKAGEEPAVLSPAQLQSISTYIDILLRWNARINLTAIRDPKEIVTRHFGESLFAARHLFPITAHLGTSGQLRPGGHVDPSGRAALQGRVTFLFAGPGFSP